MTVTVSPQCVYVCMYAHAWCAICVHEPEAFQTHNPRIHPHYTRLKQRLHSIFVTLRYFRSSNIFFLYQTKTTWVNTTAFSKFWFHLVVVKKILNLLSPMWKCNSVKVSVHNPTTWKRMRKKGIQGRIPRWKPFLTRKNTKPRLTFEPHGFWENIPWTDETKTELFWCKNKDGDVKTPALNDSKETKSRFWIRIVKVWT